ncbi:MAG TPA: hypothetical protein VM050_09675 [Patescibacteria group bacterium]|nr:hypothetical protein [Patescibacteria group bacterium]
MGSVNPFCLCTWRDEAECEGCELRGKLNCRWRREDLRGFLLIVIPFAATAVPGMYIAGRVTGSWLLQALYIAFIVVFFTLLESRILCRHCPFYSRTGFTLRCYANHGLPKLWGYQPSPAGRWERAIVVVSFAVFGGLPLLTELTGLQAVYAGGLGGTAEIAFAGLVAATFLAVVSGFTLLSLFYCPRCVNFSCPFNRVEEGLREKYLDKNPVIAAAWRSLNQR